MTNPILASHYPMTSNTILLPHSWPNAEPANGVLNSHAGDYPGGGADTVSVRFQHEVGGGNINITSGTLRARVFKY